MKVRELQSLINEIAMDEIKRKIINESEHEKKEVYHIKCEGEPVMTFDTEEEAHEHLDKLKKDHPGKQFIIEKATYESHEDMIHKLDEMGEQLEEENNTENMESIDIHEHMEHNDDGYEEIDVASLMGDSGHEDKDIDEGDASMSMVGEDDDSVGFKSEVKRRLEDELGRPPTHQELVKAVSDEIKKQIEKDEEMINNYEKQFNEDGDCMECGGMGEIKEEGPLCECGGQIMEDGCCNECGNMYEHAQDGDPENVCPKCGKQVCECGSISMEEGGYMGTPYDSSEDMAVDMVKKGIYHESKKRTIRLTESELIAMIKDMVNESMQGDPGTKGVPGVTITKRAQQGSKKENDDYVKSVEKKMKDYMSFEGNDNPEFPHQIGKGEKVARQNTPEQDEEVSKNFAGLQNLDYDVEPDEKFKERQKKAIEGHSTMGNAPIGEKPSIEPSNGADKGEEPKEKEGNVIETPETAKKINKQVKDRQKDKDERVLYPKEKVPMKSVNESRIQFTDILNEEIEKMKKLVSYNKKTQ